MQIDHIIQDIIHQVDIQDMDMEDILDMEDNMEDTGDNMEDNMEDTGDNMEDMAVRLTECMNEILIISKMNEQ